MGQHDRPAEGWQDGSPGDMAGEALPQHRRIGIDARLGEVEGEGPDFPIRPPLALAQQRAAADEGAIARDIEARIEARCDGGDLRRGFVAEARPPLGDGERIGRQPPPARPKPAPAAVSFS